MLTFISPKMRELKPSFNNIDPFLNSSEKLEGLKSELLSYTTKCSGVSEKFDKLVWWKSHRTISLLKSM